MSELERVETGLGEECGVFGAYDMDGGDVAPSVYYGLFALQHRGQESCGIAVTDTYGKRKVHFRKGLGLVNEVFDEEELGKLKGNLGVGHVRYSTAGGTRAENAQPLVLNYVKGTLVIAHNGNLTNAIELRHELEYTGAIFQTTIDSEVIAYHIARERLNVSCAEDAVKKILDELEKRAEKIQMKVYLYQYPLLKVSVLEESEKWHRLTKRIGEEMIRRQAWYRWDTNGEKECEVRKYLAESYFKLGENLKAAEQYEQIRKLESNGEELEEIYEKLQLIYEEAQEYEKVWEISREAVEVLPDSERLWMNYLERYCENPEMERELCAEAVKKTIQAVPELAESEAFKQLQGKYKIVIDGENIRVGE